LGEVKVDIPARRLDYLVELMADHVRLHDVGEADTVIGNHHSTNALAVDQS
jgi:hypothetical protein